MVAATRRSGPVTTNPRKPLHLISPSSVRYHPLADAAPLPPAVLIEMTRLSRGIVAELGSSSEMSVLVTGAAPGVGTSRTVLGLAETMAHTGISVGSVDLGTSVQREEAELPPPPEGQGGLVPVPGRFARTDHEAKAYHHSGFDMLVLDSPPITLSSLAMRIAATVSGVVIVVQANRTTEAQIRETLTVVNDCGGTCLGLVLNRPRWKRR